MSHKSLRDFPSAEKRREYLSQQLKKSLNYIAISSFAEDQVEGKNIENFIGATHIPLGVAGPLIVDGQEYFLPLATTEGALVASISRGAKAITLSGGTVTLVHNVGMTRGPVFQTSGLKKSQELVDWVLAHWSELAQTAESTSHHLKMTHYESKIVGRKVFLRFFFDTDQAMGMNMATIATQAIVPLIASATGAQCLSVAGNFDSDKKPSWQHLLNGRGKQAHAEVVIPRSVVEEVLKTTPEKIAQLVTDKLYVGSAMVGSLGYNAHFANVIAAFFLACGQDPGHIVEGSLGITTAEVTDSGDLYFSVYLPSLLVGVVGGGTHLPTQQECLQLLGVTEPADVLKFASIVASGVLAGEVSLLASLSQGTLAQAHQKLARKQ